MALSVAAPFAIGLVVAHHQLVTAALGTLVAPGPHFLEFLVDIGA
jgi:hypothetical protein